MNLTVQRLWRSQAKSTSFRELRIENLVCDVDKDRSAPRRDAPLADEEKKTGKKLFYVERRRGTRGLAKEFGREVLGVIMGLVAAKIGSGI